MITRAIEESIKKEINSGRKAVILLGARQVGKTTLLRSLFAGSGNALWLNGDASSERLVLTAQSVEQLRVIIGKLWENFLISERFKRNEYAGAYLNAWFWRTQAQREIDYIEEQDGHLSAYEFKWNPSAKAKQPKAFQTAYPESSFAVINKDNFTDFLL